MAAVTSCKNALYGYTCASDVSLLFRTKTFLCVSLLWKTKSVNKRRADAVVRFVNGLCHFCDT